VFYKIISCYYIILSDQAALRTMRDGGAMRARSMEDEQQQQPQQRSNNYNNNDSDIDGQQRKVPRKLDEFDPYAKRSMQPPPPQVQHQQQRRRYVV
jgi:hypothetical protein